MFKQLSPYLLRVGVLALMLASIAWWQRPDGQLHLFFLDCDGDAVLIQTPRGGFILVDGGADPATLSTQLGRRLPFWRRSLDAVVLTQAGSARLPGQVAALTRYRAALALSPPALPRNATTNEWLRLLDAQGTPIRAMQAGQLLTLAGVQLRVLATGNGDSTGAVLLISYGRSSVLLHGAANETTKLPPMPTNAPISALVYPWDSALPEAQLGIWKPRAIIFSEGLSAEEPAQLSIQERAYGGAAVYQRRINGTVELVSDGSHIWIHSEL